MELLLLLCYRTSLAPEGGGEVDVPGIANVLQLCESSFSSCTVCGGVEPSAYINGVLSVLTQQPEIAFWTSPPVGCCFSLCGDFLPCGRRDRPTPRLVDLVPNLDGSRHGQPTASARCGRRRAQARTPRSSPRRADHATRRGHERCAPSRRPIS